MKKPLFWSFLMLWAVFVPLKMAWTQDPAQSIAAPQPEEEAKPEVVSVFVLGTVATDKDKAVSIKVKTAREANGAGLKELNGKSLKVTGTKISRLEQLVGKEVELRGQVVGGAEFEVQSYTERRTATPAESPGVQGARAPVGGARGAINAKGPSELPSASGNRQPIGAVNDPKGSGPNKPNTGAIGTLQGRKKEPDAEFSPDLNMEAAAGASAAR